MTCMTSAQVQAFKVLIFALMGAPFFILLALFFVLGTGSYDSGAFSTPAALLIVGFLGLGAHVAAGLTYGKLQPLEPGLDEDTRARVVGERFQSSTFLRFALCEMPIIVSVALAFMASGPTFVVALGGVVLGEILLFRHVMPNSWNLTKAQERLDSKGGRSGLLESFGKTAAY